MRIFFTSIEYKYFADHLISLNPSAAQKSGRAVLRSIQGEPWRAMDRPALHRVWEADSMVRDRVRELKAILEWPKEKHLVGAPSKRSFAMNKTVMEHVAQWWCPQADAPQSVPVAAVRAEARFPHSFV